MRTHVSWMEVTCEQRPGSVIEVMGQTLVSVFTHSIDCAVFRQICRQLNELVGKVETKNVQTLRENKL